MPLLLPQLLAFEVISLVLLRIALGAYFIHTGSERIATTKQVAENNKKNKKVWSFLGPFEFVLGVLFILGFVTQAAGIAGALYAVLMIVEKERSSTDQRVAHHPFFMYVFIFAVAVTLTFFGAGILAIDLPL